MAARDLAVRLLISAKDTASGVIQSLTGRVAQFGAAVAAYFSVRAITDFFAAAISGASGLEEQLDRVEAVSRATGDEMAALRAMAEEMGRTTSFTAAETAGAMEELARAGRSPTEIMQQLSSVMALAKGNGLELAQAAGIVSTALNQFNLGADQAGRVADVLAATAANAATTVDGLSQGLSYAGTSAAAAGLSVEETSALLGLMANAGVDASRAGTALNSILAQVADPASKASTALAAMGVQSGDLSGALQALAGGGARAETAILAFGQEAGPALRGLLAQGRGALQELRAELEDSAGSAEEAAATMADNLPGALAGLRSAWESLQQTLVTPLLEPIRGQVNALAQGIRDFVSGDHIGKMSSALVDGFNAAAAAAREFVGQVNLDAVTASISEFAATAGEKFKAVTEGISTFGVVVGKVLDASRVAWYAFKQSVELVAAGIAAVLAGVLKGVSLAADGLAGLGVIAESSAGKAEAAYDGMIGAAGAFKDASIESFEAMKGSLASLGGIQDDTAKSTRDLASEQKKGGDQADDSAAQLQHLIQKTEDQSDTETEAAQAAREAAEARREATQAQQRAITAAEALVAATERQIEQGRNEAQVRQASLGLLRAESDAQAQLARAQQAETLARAAAAKEAGQMQLASRLVAEAKGLEGQALREGARQAAIAAAEARAAAEAQQQEAQALETKAQQVLRLAQADGQLTAEERALYQEARAVALAAEQQARGLDSAADSAEALRDAQGDLIRQQAGQQLKSDAQKILDMERELMSSAERRASVESEKARLIREANQSIAAGQIDSANAAIARLKELSGQYYEGQKAIEVYKKASELNQHAMEKSAEIADAEAQATATAAQRKKGEVESAMKDTERSFERAASGVETLAETIANLQDKTVRVTVDYQYRNGGADLLERLDDDLAGG